MHEYILYIQERTRVYIIYIIHACINVGWLHIPSSLQRAQIFGPHFHPRQLLRFFSNINGRTCVYVYVYTYMYIFVVYIISFTYTLCECIYICTYGQIPRSRFYTVGGSVQHNIYIRWRGTHLTGPRSVFISRFIYACI